MNRANRKQLTHEKYVSILNTYVIPAFGKRKIDTIKPSELSLWQNKLLETLASKSVIFIRVTFNGIFQDALRDELIQKNPFSIVKSPKLKIERENNPFSKDEIFSILENTPDKIKAFFAIGFFTGMRTGEITALKWDDIDFENRTISVRATRNKGIETTPKTKSSIRNIDILDVLLPYLENHKQYMCNSSYIFNTRSNSPYHSANKISERYWKKTLRECNIEYRNLYQMRHTFASLMISSGEDILWVSSMLGHKNANITLQVYAKYIKNEKKQRGSFLLN